MWAILTNYASASKISKNCLKLFYGYIDRPHSLVPRNVNYWIDLEESSSENR